MGYEEWAARVRARCDAALDQLARDVRIAREHWGMGSSATAEAVAAEHRERVPEGVCVECERAQTASPRGTLCRDCYLRRMEAACDR